MVEISLLTRLPPWSREGNITTPVTFYSNISKGTVLNVKADLSNYQSNTSALLCTLTRAFYPSHLRELHPGIFLDASEKRLVIVGTSTISSKGIDQPTPGNDLLEHGLCSSIARKLRLSVLSNRFEETGLPD